MIWHYPGFPSLFVTYNVANDYFFSGHTGIAVLGAIELARLRRDWLTALAAIAWSSFEIATVIVLRAHYTMDVFTGLVAALWVATVCDALAPRIDRLLAQRLKPCWLTHLLKLKAPKGSVRLDQLQADVPGLVVAPDYFGFGLAAAFRMHQADTPM